MTSGKHLAIFLNFDILITSFILVKAKGKKIVE